ncbi:hypothetical protein M0Q97_12190 [Candidatus Dojkabacteria bacterium]|jgi:hypothetical protein|nr:hypothetical protein [Candidatus Dojkabacteria bacterium]
MPEPRKKETKNKFIPRCISHIYRYEPETLTTKSKKKKSKQAYAICTSIYDREKRRQRRKKNESLICNFDTFVNENYKEKRIDDMSIEELKNEHEKYIKLQNKGKLTPHEEFRWKKISKLLVIK